MSVAVPVAMPVTTPAAETVAVPVVLLLQLPPVTASASVVVDPSQIVTAEVGVIAEGALTIVTVVVAEQLPVE